MIIADKRSGFSIPRKWLLSLLLTIAIVSSLLLIFAFPKEKTAPLPASNNTGHLIICDAEGVEGEKFVNGNYIFDNGKTQSSEFARSGNFSSKLSAGEKLQFGITYRAHDFKPGDIITASVWRYRPEGGEGSLAVQAVGDSDFYLERSIHSREDEQGWEYIELTFTVPEDDKIKGFNIYVYSHGTADVYFDDLQIQRLTGEDFFMPEVVKLNVQDKELRKLENKRREAMVAGVLESSEDDWVKARLLSSKGTEYIPVKLRLKGDWLDHLKGDKWSFRIKVKDPNSWNQLKTFSVQTPAARSYLHEWVLHKLWQREDVLTTRYDFIRLAFNGKPLGIYAFEEHFEKQLPEFNRRREGPIVRFSEQGFWAALKRQLEHGNGLNYERTQPEILKENAVISAFQENATIQNPTLAKQFEIAQNLMYQYMLGLKKPNEIFDTDRLAKYFAICDVMGAYHGIIWHNQRFYYNPITSKLEPIGFDGFPISDQFKNTFIGHGALNIREQPGGYLYQSLFMDEDFFTKYIRYLYRYTSRRYLEQFMAEIREDMSLRHNLIKREFPLYTISETEIIDRALGIHLQILPLNEASLKVYRQDFNENRSSLRITNHHGLPLQILGYGRTKNRIEKELEEKLILEGDQYLYPTHAHRKLDIDGPANYLFYKVPGIDSVFYSTIINWKIPENEAPAQLLFSEIKLKGHPAYSVMGHDIVFKKGRFSIRENLIIPEGYKVHFPAGTQLDFQSGAGFISKSPVWIKGTPEEPVKIYSSDGTGSGFTVLQAAENSTIHFAIFENLNTLNYKGWQLTGAVNFYESEVEISKSAFRKNNCEDALNIIRSRFSLEEVVISNTPFDGLDVDFGEGKITNSTFINTANDGIDLSGSRVTIENCLLDNCQDKGISVGEASQATVVSATIQNSNIGVASKDLSNLTIDHISLVNCQLGFTAYQKKPEFGHGTIIVKDYKAENLRRLYNIPQNNILELKGQRISGN